MPKGEYERDPCEDCGKKVPTDDTGVCIACRKVRAGEIETREEYYQNLGKKGGQALAAMRKGEKGLPRDELGPLEDAEDAMRWLTLIGYAIGESVISAKAGHALVRCVSEWRETKAESAVSEEVDELRELVEELVEEREKAPW